MGGKVRHVKSVDNVENFERRRNAVVKRMIASKDASKKCSLFAWGRMTITIKDKKGDTMELWKPKRRDIIAIFADIYQNREKLFEHVKPYKMVFEDATAINAPSTELDSDIDDFVSIQEELDRHWGVHKRKLCPGLKKPNQFNSTNGFHANPSTMFSSVSPSAYIPSNQNTYSYSSTPRYTTLQNGNLTSLMSAAHMLSNLDSRYNGSYYQEEAATGPVAPPQYHTSYSHPHGSPREYEDNCVRPNEPAYEYKYQPAVSSSASSTSSASYHHHYNTPASSSVSATGSATSEGKHWRPW
eukprot:Nk52_evm81s230 gene=Nk52_evmTU81s230